MPRDGHDTEILQQIELAEKPLRDAELMKSAYEQGITQEEISKASGKGKSTVSQWMRRHGLTLSVDPEKYDIPEHAPYLDRDLLEEMYILDRLSTLDIAAILDCSNATVSKYLREHGLKVRTRSEGQNIHHSGNPHAVALGMDSDNYMRWTPGDDYISVHRLLAVSEWGVEAVKGMQVHHKNGIRWDNRVDNLELLTNSDHQKEHAKFKGLRRLRIAELYENGDISSRKLAAHLDFEISSATVLDIHKEFYGGVDDAEA